MRYVASDDVRSDPTMDATCHTRRRVFDMLLMWVLVDVDEKHGNTVRKNWLHKKYV